MTEQTQKGRQNWLTGNLNYYNQIPDIEIKLVTHIHYRSAVMFVVFEDNLFKYST